MVEFKIIIFIEFNNYWINLVIFGFFLCFDGKWLSFLFWVNLNLIDC